MGLQVEELIENLQNRYKALQSATKRSATHLQERQTRRERLKSAPYLRLKKRKTIFRKKLEILRNFFL